MAPVYSSRIRFPAITASTPPDAIRSRGRSIGLTGSPVLGVLLVEFVLVFWAFVAELPEPEVFVLLLLLVPESEPPLSPVPESPGLLGLPPSFFFHSAVNT